MEQMDDKLLFRWFVGLSMDAAVWDATVFTKNRDRLLEGEVASKFLAAVVAQARGRNLLSEEHVSVDGTLIEAWASIKSFRPKDGGGELPGPGRNGERDFCAEKQSNQSHASTTDPEAKLYRKGNGQSSRMAFLGHVLMENRNGLVVGAMVTQATGTAERAAALALVDGLAPKGRITLGANKGDDAREFVGDLRRRKVTLHLARNDHQTKTGKRRSSAIDGRTTRHPGYAISLRIRKRVEEIFGWTKGAQDTPQRHGPRWLGLLYPDRRRLQPCPAAEADGGRLIVPGIRLKTAGSGKIGRKGGPQLLAQASRWLGPTRKGATTPHFSAA